jgi:altronate hydrolase
MTAFTKIDPHDDVIIALRDCQKGEILDGVTLLDDVRQGHKIAIRDLPKGHKLIKYGNVIGLVSAPIQKGQWVHSHNLVTSLPSFHPSYVYEKESFEMPAPSLRTFMGYLRQDGRAGIRDDLFLIPTVGCVNGTCQLIRSLFLSRHPSMKDAVKVLAHPYGCSQLGEDFSTTQKLLVGLAKNPDAGGVLLVGLGCENNRLSSFLPALEPYDHKRILSFSAQEVKDDVSYGAALLEKLFASLQTDQRVPLPLRYLTVGLKCGGSDGLSGLTANPLVGLVSDLLGSSGAKVALSEVPEMFGAEQQLMNRSHDKAIFEKTVRLIEAFKAYYAENNQPCYENPSPGNKDGGITTLEEKSSGCVLKGGHLEITDVIDVGEQLTKPGLSLVNGPGNDLVAATNLAASGCNVLFFTTGRGTPFGSVIPTIKIATNHPLAETKASWIDFDGERCLDEGFLKARDALLELLIKVASGQEVKAESAEMAQIALFKTGVTL